MPKSSLLTFQGIERRSRLMPRRSAIFTAALRMLACALAFGAAARLDAANESGWTPLLLAFCGFTLLGFALRLADRSCRWVRYLLFVEIFYVQILGYHSKALIFVEYFFIPLALLDIGYMFPVGAAVPIELVGGIAVIPLMSFSFQAHASLMAGGLSIPLLMITLPCYAACACANSLLAISASHQAQMLAVHNAEISVNRNLDSINRVLSSRMFSIKSESELTAKMQVTKDVHDNVGYIFTNLIMMLQATEAVYERDPAKAKGMLSNCVEYSRQGMNEIRHTLRVIRQADRPAAWIQKEMNDLIRLFSRCTGASVSIEYGNWPRSFSPQIDSFLLSFVKETLTNALKHGMAASIRITCWLGKRELSMTVQDNGTGCRDAIRFGIGLQSIQESVARLGGELSAASREDGFRVRIQLPLPS